MTFLNPFVLLGLAAAAIPVILHLLNLRKLRTIEFSTLSFLKELQQTKIRKLKIRQIILLIIRTLLVIFIVLAFARPAIRGSFLGHIGSHAHSSVVFILDDSFSMMASDENGELFKQAKTAVENCINLLNEGDEAYLIKLSDLPRATVDPATHDFDALRTMIKEAHSSPIRRPIEDALRLSAKLLSQSKNANKEVYVISDVQRTLFPSNLQQHTENTLALFEAGVRFFVVKLGSSPALNVSIDSVEVTTKILEKDRPANVYVSIRNFSSVPLQNSVVSIFLDGTRVAQNNVQAEAWGLASMTLTVTPKRTGLIKGFVELENDALELDNKRYFTVNIPEHIDVTVVASNPSDAHFPLLTLKSESSEEKDALIRIHQTSPQKFSLVDVQNADIVVMIGIKAISAGSADLIKKFVEEGRGLIIFPGSDDRLPDFNVSLLSSLSIPQVEGVVGNPTSTSMQSFRNIDFDHPVFATVFEQWDERSKQSGRNIESPAILMSLKRQSGKQGHTIISLGDGTPFLSEHTLGRGKILFYSVAPVLAWSDFPLKGVFVPLVYRSIVYASSHADGGQSYLAGDEAMLTLPQSGRVSTESQYQLVSPDGTEELIIPHNVASSDATSGQRPMSERSLMFDPKSLALPGFFELRQQKSLLSLIAVNVDGHESDCRRISDDEWNEFWARLGVAPTSIQTLRQAEEVQSAILQSRFGVELWKYCITLALLLALLEMLIARDSRKEAMQVNQPAHA